MWSRSTVVSPIPQWVRGLPPNSLSNDDSRLHKHAHTHRTCHRQVRATLAVCLHTPLQLLPLAVNGVLKLLLSGSNSLHSRLVYDCGSGVPALCNGANAKPTVGAGQGMRDRQGSPLGAVEVFLHTACQYL